ncbi:MAG TPA: AbrB family transcriptional regulator [Thermoleophilaceae bacterium]
MRNLAALAALGIVTFGIGYGLEQAGLPSSYLFGALLIGLAVALLRPGGAWVPDPVFVAGQALTGVALGAFVRSSALTALAHSWLPVTLVSAGTLAICVVGGILLTRFTALDEPTAQLGSVAGGASGIVAMADDLGADARLVAFMQYLRVLVVVLLTPLILAIGFPGHGGGHAPGSSTLGDPKDWLLSFGIAVVGVVIARSFRMTAGTLLVPMVLAAGVVLAIPGGEFTTPTLVAQTAFAIIGLQVGLRFTMDTVRLLGRLVVPVLISIGVLLVACFGLALILEATTPESLLTSYLATTPGGFFAVLAVAFGSGANTTFILAVQALRLLVMVLLAPLLVRRLTASARAPVAAG